MSKLRLLRRKQKEENKEQVETKPKKKLERISREVKEALSQMPITKKANKKDPDPPDPVPEKNYTFKETTMTINDRIQKLIEIHKSIPLSEKQQEILDTVKTLDTLSISLRGFTFGAPIERIRGDLYKYDTLLRYFAELTNSLQTTKSKKG